MTICIGGHNGKTFNHLRGLKQTNSCTNSAEMCVRSATRICERKLWPHRKEILFLDGNKIKWRANGDSFLVLTSVSSRDLEEYRDFPRYQRLKSQYELKCFSSNFMTHFESCAIQIHCIAPYEKFIKCIQKCITWNFYRKWLEYTIMMNFLLLLLLLFRF